TVLAEGGAYRQGAMADSPLASGIAAEHNLDVIQVTSSGKRIQKTDVLTYLQDQEKASSVITGPHLTTNLSPRFPPASPKARRLAAEQGKDLAVIMGTGPEGAVLAADVIAAIVQAALTNVEVAGVVPAAG